MRLYRFTGTAEFVGAVEADTLVEAIRKVDEVLKGADQVRFVHGEEELCTSAIKVRRGRIAVEN